MIERGPAPLLMLVTDRRRSRRPLPELVAAAVVGGVDAVQLREPDLDPPELARLAARLRDVVAGRAALLVNNAPEVAEKLGLGLHLPERGPAASEARRRIGPDRLLGRSVHSPAAAAAALPVDYLLAGHAFATPSKPGRPPLGPAGLRRIADAAGAPLLAIGGVTVGRVPAVLGAGAVGVAVIGAIAEAADPERAASALRAAVDGTLEEIGEAAMRSETDGAIEHEQLTIVANGKPIELPRGVTVDGFLAGRGLTAGMAIVERNGEIVPRAAYGATVLSPGDRLEVVHAVGGG